MVGHYDYSRPAVQEEIENITRMIEASHPYLKNDIYTDSWLRSYLDFTQITMTEGAAEKLLNNETSFNTYLQTVCTVYFLILSLYTVVTYMNNITLK